jgi:multidrug efflux system membrane fusion protein
MTAELPDTPRANVDKPEGGAAPIPRARSTWLRRWPWLLVCGAIVLAASLIYSQANQGPSKGAEKLAGGAPAPRAVPVVTTAARQGDLPLYLTGLGTVMALNTVTLRSRVDGQLIRVAFTEGQKVQEGDLLFEIDPRPFQVQLAQAEGQLAKDAAALKNARLDLERNELAKDAVSAQQLATQAATVAQLEGIVKSNQAQVDNAKLQLTYSRITAPISGRIGLRLVDAGNMIRSSDAGGLAVITQVKPITVVFNLPQDSLRLVTGKVEATPPLVVEAYDRDLKTRLATGALLAIDNQVDLMTGTIRFKALFPNDDESLFPNQFVNARLLVDTKRDAVLAPAAALQRSPRGQFVYIVKADSTVETRPVVAGLSEGGEVSIDSGLAPGEVVVTDGVDKLRNGSKVEVRQGKGSDGKGKGEGRKAPAPETKEKGTR